MAKLFINNTIKEFDDNLSYYDVARQIKEEFSSEPFLVKVDGVVKELRSSIKEGENLEFLFFDSEEVKLAYNKTAIYIMLKAIHDSLDKKYEAFQKFKTNNGYYFEIENKKLLDEEFEKIKKRFDEIVNDKILIKKISHQRVEAFKLFDEKNMQDVKLLFQYNYKTIINLRYIDDFVKYINGELLYDTSFVKHYKIVKYKYGILLLLPDTNDITYIKELPPSEKYFIVQNDSIDWAKKLSINTIGKLNRHIAKDEFDDLVIMSESLQDKKIGDVADAIFASNKKLIFIAGPSCSGKTTFSHRLMYHLRALDLNPYPIASDNFYKNRSEIPFDENGEQDFEIIEAMDVELINDTLKKLLAGEEVDMPTFNFATGKKEYNGNKLKIKNNDLIIFEGIHCLNDKLTYKLNPNDSFKVYLSALSNISIDNANRISTSDLRLIRRIVRDSRERGYDAKETIKRWASVKKGENISIFPYQDNGDVFFNSSLIYEFCILKTYAAPLLYDIADDEEVGVTARRLIKFLNYFLGVNTEAIPKYSVIREFIGGGII